MDYAKLAHVNSVWLREADDTRLARDVLRHLTVPEVKSSMADEAVYQTMINRSDDFAEFRAAHAEGREPRYQGS